MDRIKRFKNRIKRSLFKNFRRLDKKYPQYDIGRHTYGKLKVLSWGEDATLKIGAFCSITNGVKIFLGGDHRVDWATTYPFSFLWEKGWDIPGHPGTKGDVIIGNDVWVGTEAIIMSGVTIGDGAVIGARAVVAKDIEPYAIYAGNPARLVRKRFDDSIVQQLLALKWWDFNDSEIEQLLPFMLSTDIKKFIVTATRIKQNCR